MRAFGRPIELPSLRDRFNLGRKVTPPEKKDIVKCTSIPAMNSNREKKEPRKDSVEKQLSNPMMLLRAVEARSKGSFVEADPKRPSEPKPTETRPEPIAKGKVEGKIETDKGKATETLAPVVPKPPSEPRPPPKHFKDPPRGFDHSRAHKSAGDHPTVVQTPREVLDNYNVELVEFEKTEILAFEKIYYFGTFASKTRANAAGNDGFDDENGDYIGNLHDHIMYRFEIVGHLGRGSFGQVLKCHDRAARAMVAVKIVRNKQKFQEQSIVEAQLLQHMKAADPDHKSNVIRLYESFTFRNHLCLSFELLSMNLYEHLRLEQFRGLPIPLIKKIAVEILIALNFLKSQRIVHCDLKPENILLTKPKGHNIAIIDFGSSCFENATFFTYIQSRFYRAPEVVLGLQYGHAIDMWSFGCIVAELFTGYPVFPGENEAEQLACIMEVMDVPPKAMIDGCKRRKNFFDDSGEPLSIVNSRGRKRRPKSRELRALLKCQDHRMVDFVGKCLTWDPQARLSPADALAHEWLADVKPETKPTKPPRLLKPKDSDKDVLANVVPHPPKDPVATI
ncbi:hypothetical protein ACHHYP_09183 [Achlya hypogyna]|uniref:dual-specificity kinase n=1 Tax=Achlya hypogyna TaxID=1202772 RepID=A0A1V9ZJA9_ACHHY|nr:hypothetical protein ACHHYP_09183 [Achlya hypogyna]